MNSSMEALFLKHVGQTSPYPPMLEIERAEGLFLYDKSGKKYIDAISGICVSALGHSHPNVVSAIKEQAEKYLHPMVYGEFVLAPQVEYAKLLTDHLPDHLNCVFYINTGSEAVEGAMKLAKRATGRPEIIACKGAYHGSTQGAMSLMSDEKYKKGYYPLTPGIRYIGLNDFEDLNLITSKTACVILEPIQAAPGIRPAEKAYLQALKQKCQDTGALLIYDEIQISFGRTGSLFAFEQFEVAPDVLLLAKALGGGLPLGALIADRKLLSLFTHNPILGFISTFGGHPLSCVAGKAMLETILQEELMKDVKSKAERLKSKLMHPLVVDVRNAGLLMAVDFGNEAIALKVVENAYKVGLVTGFFLFNEQSIRIAPPLNITAEEIDLLAETLLIAIEMSR